MVTGSLAALLFEERAVDGGGAAEQRAQAFVVLNRSRYKGRGWPATIEGVIDQRGQFGGATYPGSRYECLVNKSCTRCLKTDECRSLKRLLAIAQKVLDDPEGLTDPIRQATGRPAFYFNQSTTDPPDGPDSPLLRPAGEDGWTHSFWGSNKARPR